MVNGQMGDGTERGSGDEDYKCTSDGSCEANCKISGAVGNGHQRGSCDEGHICHKNGSCTSGELEYFFADIHFYHVQSTV